MGVGLAATQLTLVKKDGGSGWHGQWPGQRSKSSAEVGATCSVGCATDAIENGVWVRQEAVSDLPINLGAHCTKGVALREHGNGEYRLRNAHEAGEWQVHQDQLGSGAG